MTEEKAKEILVFLCKRSGYDCIHIEKRNSNENIYMIKLSSGHQISFLWIFINMWKIVEHELDSTLKSGNFYLKLLSSLFEKNKENSVYVDYILEKTTFETYTTSSGMCGICFMKKNESLEEILIEMDLKK